jgi:hypothetical protein
LEGGYTLTLSKDKYKAKLLVPISEDASVEIVANILRVDDNKVCFEFYKAAGDSWQFFD